MAHINGHSMFDSALSVVSILLLGNISEHDLVLGCSFSALALGELKSLLHPLTLTKSGSDLNPALLSVYDENFYILPQFFSNLNATICPQKFNMCILHSFECH